MDNGDIITACSDGIARIWTSERERYSEASEREAYVSLITQYKISRLVHTGLRFLLYLYSPVIFVKAVITYVLTFLCGEYNLWIYIHLF